MSVTAMVGALNFYLYFAHGQHVINLIAGIVCIGTAIILDS